MNRHLLRRALRLPQAALKRLVTGLLQLVLLANRPARLARSGFVLPTTVLLVLMVVLTATALTYRSFTRSDMAISQREQQVITNAATPAIDRAKAKIEFLFRSDQRFPSGLPNSDYLADMMLATPLTGSGVDPLPGVADPYSLPGETRLDINGDGELDNAWSFLSDVTNDIVVYSVLVDDAGPLEAIGVTIENPDAEAKANALVTRTGPLATTEATPRCSGSRAENGWQVVETANSSTLQKNFQINAFVANSNPANTTFQTLEVQQSRDAARANKWGAWFRYDLEIFPGATFNWNGAMHTDGSFFIESDKYTSYMVSSHNSCVYSKEASEITLGEEGAFQGQAVKGNARDNVSNNTSNPLVHVWQTSDRTKPRVADRFNADNDSVTAGTVRPSEISMNAMALYTEDLAEHVRAPGAGSWNRDANWAGRIFETNGRIRNDPSVRPFVDDFFRADNRWGPKPNYDSRNDTINLLNQPATVVAGDPIDESFTRLTGSPTSLDGFWERQAIESGLRLIVSERLELGNANGWNSNPRTGTLNVDADALYPPEASRSTLAVNVPAGPLNIPPAISKDFVGGNHEYLQRRSLRDNLAAVQSMVVYHYDHTNGGEFPAACMAMTAHPGTRQSIVDSRTFENYPAPIPTTVKTDFFNGKGTNGWEFQYPNTAATGFRSPSTFAAQIVSTQPLGKALRNLANFAGDPDGGAPSFRPVQDVNGVAGASVHPAPFLHMWGDFSILRRVLANYDAASGSAVNKYNALSPADRATLHSAACTLSMLAYSVQNEVLAYESIAGDNLTDVGQSFWSLIDPGNTGNSNADLSNYVGANYRKFPTTAGSFFPGENVIVTPGIVARANWVDPTPTGTCPSGAADAAGFQVGCDEAEYYNQFSSEDFIRAYLFNSNNNATARATALTEINKIRSFLGGYQILRDRALGFVRGPLPSQLTPEAIINVGWDEDELATIPNPNGQLSGKKYRTACNPNIFTGIGGNGDGKGTKKVGLAVALCSVKLDTKYPSLYYLFPLVDHAYAGADDSALVGGYNHTQPPAENYIADPYVQTVSTGVGSWEYKRINATTPNSVSAVAGEPKALSAALSTWTVPVATGTAITTANIDDLAQAFSISTPGGVGAAIRVPFLDKGVLDGREQLNTRVLDIDMEALTRQRVGGTGDFWISADPDKGGQGIVYAFREDAVREDEIVRPRTSGKNLGDCQTMSGTPRAYDIESEDACQMRIAPPSYQDPPLTDRLISIKPVDFIPDPQRRPHGFRLRTASGSPADFSGQAVGASPGPRQVGMTFVTDNSTYVLGDFNLHTTTTLTTVAGVETPTASLVEEFKTLLPANFNDTQFYNNRAADDLNTEVFATLSKDHWRPVEILADSLGVLSSNFKDGAVADVFTRNRPGSRGGGTSSYMGMSRPDTGRTDIVREGNSTSPFWIDRNGTFFVGTQPFFDFYTDTGWTNFGTNNDIRRRNIQDPTVTRVNALFVSGIVPKRPDQSYGGLQNFPRFLEDWKGKDLVISGSFFQLNFSNAATGPFDQDAWEADTVPLSGALENEKIGYYDAPNRLWGYDVGLLYVPPGPAARRFISIGASRSEYFRELPSDDPYIVNLRCAVDVNGAPILAGRLCPA